MTAETVALSAPNDSADGTGLPVRPLPIGAFPLPLGYLLVPAGADTEAARLDLLAGRLPTTWPDRMAAHRLVVEGDQDAALAALTGDDPVSRFNRFVLDPVGGTPETLRADLGELGVLVDVVAFTVGVAAGPPVDGAATGEVGALVLCARATHALADGDAAGAVDLLDAAVSLCEGSTPVLAAVLRGAAAGAEQQRAAAPTDGVVDRLEAALRGLDEAQDMRVARSETHLAAGLALHELGQTGRAIPHYHAALRLVTSVEAPLVWASAHANLAAAYLTAPMTQASDQLRTGIAVQSLRSALTVYTRADHPTEWASAQLNLANSLVYSPSTHQADNLVEAVELYEEVLEVRSRDEDPMGRARVLANQGNVLAHLGMFDVAKAKLYDARFVFEEFGDVEAVRTVRGVLDEIARQQALRRSED
jgi:tetratricopeptide (TPR) repeat protein